MWQWKNRAGQISFTPELTESTMELEDNRKIAFLEVLIERQQSDKLDNKLYKESVIKHFQYLNLNDTKCVRDIIEIFY